jgi:hypothetical protein
LLGLLDLTGTLVTGDANHGQAATARLVAERGVPRASGKQNGAS